MSLLRDLGAGAYQAIAERFRADGWSNPITGMGTVSRDRQQSTDYQERTPFQPMFTAGLYMGDAIAARIADAKPKGALRRGILTSNAAVTKQLAKLRTADVVAFGLAAGLATGGALVVPITGDKSPETPRPDGQALQPITRLEMFDRQQVENSRTAGVLDGCFRVTPLDSPAFVIHRSRCLVFGGIPTLHKHKHTNAGWDHSIYDRIYDGLRMFHDGYLSLGHMIGDASQGVLTMKGIMAQLGQEGGKERLAERAQIMSFYRAINRTMLLDAGDGETFTKVPTQFSGVPDSIDRFANFLSAITGIPVTVLMGQSPAGLNATGASDVLLWYDELKTYQLAEVSPAIEQLVDMIAPGTTIAFPELYQPTDKEKADLQKVRADTHKVWIDAGALFPEELAAAIATGKEPKPEMSLRMLPPDQAPDPAALPAGAPTEAAPTEAKSNISITPSDQTVVLKVRHALEYLGQDPMSFGPEDAELTVLEFKAKRASLLALTAGAESGADPNAPPEPPAPVAPPDAPPAAPPTETPA